MNLLQSFSGVRTALWMEPEKSGQPFFRAKRFFRRLREDWLTADAVCVRQA